MNKFVVKFQNGFTLAEVLVTLVIVGVIAAVTIPTLINNLQKNELRSQFKKAVSVTSQAIQKIKIDNGDIIYNSDDDVSVFRDKLLKNFSVVCTDNCLNIEKYKNHADKYKDPEMNRQLQNCFTAQDSMIFCFYKGEATSTMYINTDINGDRGPNRWGYDVFAFYIHSTDQVLLPVSLVAPISSFYCNYTNNTHNGPACTEAAMRDSEYFKKLH